jgi:hypothetical protein
MVNPIGLAFHTISTFSRQTECLNIGVQCSGGLMYQVLETF